MPARRMGVHPTQDDIHELLHGDAASNEAVSRLTLLHKEVDDSDNVALAKVAVGGRSIAGLSRAAGGEVVAAEVMRAPRVLAFGPGRGAGQDQDRNRYRTPHRLSSDLESGEHSPGLDRGPIASQPTGAFVTGAIRLFQGGRLYAPLDAFSLRR